MEINNIIEKSTKSIQFELRNYKYWCTHLLELEQKKYELETKLYNVSAISYNYVAGNRIEKEQILSHYITEKNELQEEINRVQYKINFVDYFLKSLDPEERDFLDVALVKRHYNDTNDTVAVRLELSESGLRYKINMIIRNAIIRNLQRGGMVEQTATRSIW